MVESKRLVLRQMRSSLKTHDRHWLVVVYSFNSRFLKPIYHLVGDLRLNWLHLQRVEGFLNERVRLLSIACESCERAFVSGKA